MRSMTVDENSLLKEFLLGLERRMEGLEVSVRDGFARVDAQFESMSAGSNHRFDRLDCRLDETNARLDETNARLDETNARLDFHLDETNARLQEVESRLDDTNLTLAAMDGQIVSGFAGMGHYMFHVDQRCEERLDEFNFRLIGMAELVNRFFDPPSSNGKGGEP